MLYKERLASKASVIIVSKEVCLSLAVSALFSNLESTTLNKQAAFFCNTLAV